MKQTRSRRRTDRTKRLRRGAALLIVVLVLLLLAIVGTAFISTTREDRVSAYQNAENSQVDLYVDGVVNIAKSILVGDVFGSGSDRLKWEYRPVFGLNYSHYTSSIQYNGGWLASRVPEPRPLETYDRPETRGPFDKYNWPFVSLPPHLRDEQKSSVFPFISPLNPKASTYRVNNAALSLSEGGEDYPALQYGKLPPMVAADADGDGIADSGLWPLTKQPRNGISYFAALRITDNCAAINVNTAWLRDHDLALDGGRIPNAALTPSNIGLVGLLRSSNASREMAAVNLYRFGGGPLNPAAELDNGQARGDFEHYSQAERFYAGLGSRLGNPGPNGYPTRFQPFTSLDGASLAYRFCMLNPDVAPSPVEQVFLAAAGGWDSGTADSLVKSAANYYRDPLDMWREYARRKDANGNYAEDHLQLMERWWSSNFNYDGDSFSLRPLLVTSNAVSNAISVPRRNIDGDSVEAEPANPGMLPYVSSGVWSGGETYRQHELVKHQGLYYVSMHDGNSGSPPSGTMQSNADWEFQTWSVVPQKACLPTASFRDLWRAFWCTMVTTADGSDGGIVTSKAPELNRSPLRNGMEMQGDQVAQLRAAIAAVNVLAMRDRSNNVISRMITLYQPTSSTVRDVRDFPQFQVMVYSAERQPIISEALVHTDPNGPYLAVELYNPYPDPIPLKNWHFANLTRNGASIALTDLGELTKTGITEIPGKGFVSFENKGDMGRPVDLTLEFTTRGTSLKNVTRLGEAVGQELVLLRPRRADGTLSSSSYPFNPFNEGTEMAPNLAQLVPVDQINLRDINPTDQGEANPDPNQPGTFLGVRYHYARDTATPSDWRFFYPGRYFIAPKPGKNDPPPTTPDTWQEGMVKKPGTSGSFNRAGGASYTRTTVLRLNDWYPMPGSLGGSPNRSPFGIFAYAGDVLRVPYAGAYTIWSAGSGAGAAPLEMNSVPMDSQFMQDPYQTDAPRMIGRFSPPKTPGNVADWTTNILEFFTVRSYETDYLPNYSPQDWGQYDSNGNFSPLPLPTPIANTDPRFANGDEPPAGVQGLVNVNTAPWIVLAQLPLVVTPSGSVDAGRTEACAGELARVSSFNGRRPMFKTVLDVNDVLLKFSHDPDPPIEDVERRFAPIIRLSNLLTVRSDSFTVYIVIEGWRDAYTPQAKRVLQRRVAFLADRSGITETNRELRMVNIPTN